LLQQVTVKLTQFVTNLKTMQQIMQKLVQTFQQFNKELQTTNQTIVQLTQSIRQADDINNQFETDLGTTTDQLYQLQQQIVYVTQSLLDMEQMETWAAQEFSWMGIDAQQAGKEIDQAMQQAGKAVDKLDESVKKLIDDLEKLIKLMQQAGLSGGGGGGGAGGAGASVGASAVAGLTGSSGIASASPSQKTTQAGQDFTQGFVNGIQSNASGATAAAADLGSSSVSSTANAIGAASYSRRLHEIGRWFVEGFWRGMRDEERECRKVCEEVTQVAVHTFQATSSLNAQYNTGVLYGRNLANGIVSQINAVKLASGKLAQAATSEATAQLAKMGLVGQAGSGAQMPEPANIITPGSGPAQSGGGKHCVHEHRLYIDGREIRDMTDKQVAKALDRLTDMYSQQKR
ncbi:MAG: hypothetical protein JWO67_6462, partial [Streptosporangiaceae bacterium]|nr:hypothetical protein [Streptosporangiaceae bacterium]